MDQIGAQTTAVPLVGDGRIVKPVTQDYASPLKCGLDDAFDELGACCLKKQQLSHGGDVEVLLVEEKLAHCLAQARRPGFAQTQRFATLRAQGVFDEAYLRRLAHSVKPLKTYEDAGAVGALVGGCDAGHVVSSLCRRQSRIRN